MEKRKTLVDGSFRVPVGLVTERFRLRMLTINDLVKDYDAVMSSVEHLRNTFSKISESDKKAIETGISELRNALKGTDTEEVKKKTQSLIQSSMKLGEAVYKSQQKTSASKSESKKQTSKDKDQNKENVVDADFEEVKDDKENKDKQKRA